MVTSGLPHFSVSEVLAYPGNPERPNWLLFVTWMNVVAAGSLTMVTDSADFCRYTRSRTDMWLGTLIGKVGGGCFAALPRRLWRGRDAGQDRQCVRDRLRASAAAGLRC